MGLFDWFDSDNDQTKQSTSLPSWQTGAQKDAVTMAQQLVKNQKYTPYNQQRIADFTPDQLAGFQAVRDNVNSYKPSLNAAQNLFMGIGSTPANAYSAMTGNASMQDMQGDFDSAAASRYMNPYIENVVNNSARQLNEQKGRDQLALDSNAVKSGAFGGSRRAIGQSELNKNYANQLNDLTANLYAQGYNNAQGQFNTDRSARMGINTANQNAANQFGLANLGFQNQALANNQNAALTGQQQQLGAAQGLAGLGGQYQQLGLNAGNALTGIGAQQQGLTQQAMDLKKNDFDQQQNWAQNQIKFLSDIANGVASGNSQTTTQTPGVSGLNTALGAGVGIASLGNMFGWW